MLGEQDLTARSREAAETRPASTDAELAMAAFRDPYAFEQLYLRYADRIYRYAAGQTGSMSLAEEIVSDTMLAAFERLERFDPSRGSVASWLFTIARHRIADEKRRLSRLRRALSRRGADSESDEDALSLIIRSERAAQMHVVLGLVSAKDREVLLLRYVAELSAPEIGELLGLSAGAVRVRIHRALRRLAIELGDDDAP